MTSLRACFLWLWKASPWTTLNLKLLGEAGLHDETSKLPFPIEFLFNELTEWIWTINKSMKGSLSSLFDQTVYALLSWFFLPLVSHHRTAGHVAGLLLNISQMNGNQNQMTRLPGPIISIEFEWSGGCEAPSLISLANAFLSPISVTMTKGLGAKSGHEPLFLMTAESVGNFSCAATRNDWNASADAGTSCHGLISRRWQGGRNSQLSVCLSAALLLSWFMSHSKCGCCDA